MSVFMDRGDGRCHCPACEERKVVLGIAGAPARDMIGVMGVDLAREPPEYLPAVLSAELEAAHQRLAEAMLMGVPPERNWLTLGGTTNNPAADPDASKQTVNPLAAAWSRFMRNRRRLLDQDPDGPPVALPAKPAPKEDPPYVPTRWIGGE